MESNICEYTIRGESKYFVRLNDKITDDEAYLIGYMACDGGYTAGKPGYSFSMVSSVELPIIEWVKSNFLPCATLRNTGRRSSAKVTATNDVYEIRFTPKASQQFSRFGIFCKKPERRLVGIPKKRMNAYMAGVIEADGFITVGHKKDCRTPRLRFFVTHGGEKFLADLQEWLPVPTTLRQHGDNVWRLQAQNTTQNAAFLAEVLPFMKNAKKKRILTDYLDNYTVRQAPGELLESGSRSAAKPQAVEGSETT